MTKREQVLVADGFEPVKNAAKFLGISRSRVYELIAGGVLTHARLGGRLVVSRSALREYAAGLLEIGPVA